MILNLLAARAASYNLHTNNSIIAIQSMSSINHHPSNPVHFHPVGVRPGDEPTELKKSEVIKTYLN